MPQFELTAHPAAPITTASNDEQANITSGALTARFQREPWALEFIADGRVLTASGSKAMAQLTTAGGESYVREQLSLGVGEVVYGLGERFGPLVKNGQVVDIWNADGGTSSEQAYKNVPFYLTNARLRGLRQPPRARSRSRSPPRRCRGSSSAWPASHWTTCVIYGPKPEGDSGQVHRADRPAGAASAVVVRPVAVAPRSPPPTTRRPSPASSTAWPSASCRCRCSTSTASGCASSTGATSVGPPDLPRPGRDAVPAEGQGAADLRLDQPLHRPALAVVRRRAESGFLLRRPNGDVWQSDKWQAGMGIVDFTNPGCSRVVRRQAARASGPGRRLLQDRLRRAHPHRCRLVATAPTRSGCTTTTRYLYNQTVFELLRSKRGEGEAVVFARSATAGGQRFPVHWGGDCESTFVGHGREPARRPVVAASGFGFWSHDIGGFEGTSGPGDLQTLGRRSGCSRTHSRLHGSDSYRVPWLFDEESVEVLRDVHRAQDAG